MVTKMLDDPDLNPRLKGTLVRSHYPPKQVRTLCRKQEPVPGWSQAAICEDSRRHDIPQPTTWNGD